MLIDGFATLQTEPTQEREHCHRQKISPHSRIQQQGINPKIIEDHKAHYAESESSGCEVVQKVRGDPVRDPKQHSSLDQPADRDPVPVQANGNGNRNQGDSQRQVQQPQYFRVNRFAAGGDPAQRDVHASQGQRKPGHGRFIDLLHHGVRLQEIHTGINKA